MGKIVAKKVVIRRSAGLGDLLLATAHSWFYAEKTGRDLEICWAPSVYLKDKSKNAFGNIFDIPDKIGNVKIHYHDHIGPVKRFTRRLPMFPLRYLIRTLLIEITIKFLRNRYQDFFNRARRRREIFLKDLIQNGKDVKKKTVIFHTDFNFLDPKKIKPFFDSLKLKHEFEEKINQFVAHHFQNKFVIGTHVRYYDKNLPFCNYTKYWLNPEKSLETLKGRLEEIVSKYSDKDYVVYLATNSSMVCEYVRENVKNVVIFNKEFAEIKVDWSLHHLLPEKSLVDDIIEMFLLARCKILYRFPAYSWFSYLGSLYADEVINE